MAWLMPYIVAVPAGILVFWQVLKMYVPWLVQDLAYIRKVVGLLRRLRNVKKKSLNISDRLAQQAKAKPKKAFILFEEETWTYEEVHRWSNQCARALKNLGIGQRDRVGLMMMNEPAFAALWMGCIRVGGITSFLNFNLRSKSLLHCIDTAEIKFLVVGKDPPLISAVQQIHDELKQRGITVFVYCPAVGDYQSMTSLVETQPSDDVPKEWTKDMKYDDLLCYIYTSGTTGFPKAVNIDINKCWGAAMLCNLADVTEDDIMYTALPLYHSSASLIGLCGTIESGCTIALRKKFSASQFLADCQKYDVTIVQYIGETIRYVCNQPATSEDRNHKIRCAVGNGLRPDVWRSFLDRYGPDIHVLELYAATEGNVGFFNYHNHFGCVGTLSPLMSAIGSAKLVRFNTETEEMVRDSNGKAIPADYNEPALLIGKITPVFRISSYKGKKSLTDKKILHDVFKKGDEYFNTGDLLMCDRDYKVTFCDRVGDTFRWKGENVSTNEVSDTILQVSGIQEANTYGVEIPGTDGRAGMSALVLDDSGSFNMQALFDHLSDALPSYARPIFMRILPEMEVTGTFKHRKVTLKQEGFNLDSIQDQVYVVDHKKKCYTQLTCDLVKNIESGAYRV